MPKTRDQQAMRFEATQFPLQTSENCQTSKPCSNVSLFFGDFDADLAKRLSQASVRVGRTVAGDDG